MGTTPRVWPEKFVEAMKPEMEQYLKEVMEAVNRRRGWPVDCRKRRTGSRSLGPDALSRV
jgi:hypothetical protein